MNFFFISSLMAPQSAFPIIDEVRLIIIVLDFPCATLIELLRH